MIDYLQVTVDLFKTRDTYAILAAAGITPKSSGTYATSAIQAALTAYHGYAVTLRCSSSKLKEVWYHYNARGSVVTGEFLPKAPLGSNTCSGNISYLPKSGTTATTTATATATAPTSTATGVITGTGTWIGTSSSATKGGLISGGTWYVGGTLATYTATASGSGFILSTSKGNCAVTSGKFNCASGNTASVFNVVGGKLAYGGVTTWYGSAVPSGTTQVEIYTTSATGRTTAVTFTWA